LENRVLRKIFGPNRYEVTEEWKRLLYKKLHALYCSDNFRMTKSRRMIRAGHVIRTGERRSAYRVLVVRHDGKKTLGRPRRMWEDNIKMDLQHLRWGGMDWIDLAQDWNGSL
jgi:hypothetical protein